jgi:hypothetical protein
VSVTVVTLLAIAAIGCVFVLTVLFALLRAAAHSDAQLENHGDVQRQEQRRRVVAPETLVPELPSSGRFARRRERRSEAADRPLVR